MPAIIQDSYGQFICTGCREIVEPPVSSHICPGAEHWSMDPTPALDETTITRPWRKEQTEFPFMQQTVARELYISILEALDLLARHDDNIKVSKCFQSVNSLLWNEVNTLQENE